MLNVHDYLTYLKDSYTDIYKYTHNYAISCDKLTTDELSYIFFKMNHDYRLINPIPSALIISLLFLTERSAYLNIALLLLML